MFCWEIEALFTLFDMQQYEARQTDTVHRSMCALKDQKEGQIHGTGLRSQKWNYVRDGLWIVSHSQMRKILQMRKQNG